MKWALHFLINKNSLLTLHDESISRCSAESIKSHILYLLCCRRFAINAIERERNSQCIYRHTHSTDDWAKKNHKNYKYDVSESCMESGCCLIWLWLYKMRPAKHCYDIFRYDCYAHLCWINGCIEWVIVCVFIGFFLNHSPNFEFKGTVLHLISAGYLFCHS